MRIGSLIQDKRWSVIIDNNNRTKKLLLGILTVIILLGICVTVDYADQEIIKSNTTDPTLPEDAIVVNGSKVVPEDPSVGVAKLQKVVVEKPKLPLITIVSKPSCGCRNSYAWHKRTFINYCPYCRKYGVLTNLHKYPARFEQEISCKKCRSDWCGVCGKEKYSWSHRYLRKP